MQCRNCGMTVSKILIRLLCLIGSDQTVRMCRLIWGFGGRTNYIVGNLMPQLKCLLTLRQAKFKKVLIDPRRAQPKTSIRPVCIN